MRGDSKSEGSINLCFLVHKLSNQTGLLLKRAQETRTIESANGEHLTAPVCEFRKASALEIEEYHRQAAWVHPCALPTGPVRRPAHPL
jgi:hypothetical protein